MFLHRLILLLMAALCLAAPLSAGASDHAVIVHFEYGKRDWSEFFAYEEAIEKGIAAAHVGEYDGNELAVDGSDGFLYFYGPDGDKLLAVVRRLVLNAPFIKRAVATVRYGGAKDQSAREIKVELVPSSETAPKSSVIASGSGS